MAEAILVEDETGEFVSADVPELGTVTEIEVTERTVSGVVSKLVIHGSEHTISISGQSNIRAILNPVNQEIVRQDGSTVTGWTSLPSPYYYVEKDRRGICRSWWWIRTWCRDEYLWCRRAWQTGKKLQIYITALFFVC